MSLPQFTMSELLEAGVHFGHRTHRWNPKLAGYIYGSRQGVHVIDLRQTVPLMYQALSRIQLSVAQGGRVLFVGTKRQAQDVVRETAERCGMYYVNHRWLGGMLTNWQTISHSIKRLKYLEDVFEKSTEIQGKIYELKAAETPENPVDVSHLKDPLNPYTKKERLNMRRELDKLQSILGGIKDMNGLPDLIVVMDVKKDNIAVQEANTLRIPVVGIIDSNSSDEGVDLPVPGNDDATRALQLYARLFSDAVLEGIAQQAAKAESREAAAPKAAVSSKGSKKETVVTLSPKAKAAAEAAEKDQELPTSPAEPVGDEKVDSPTEAAAESAPAEAESAEVSDKPEEEAEAPVTEETEKQPASAS